MNIRLVLRLLSVIFMTLSGAFGLSFLVGAFVYDELGQPSVISGWSLCIVIAVLISILCFFLGSTNNKHFFRKEALATIGLGWITASFIGALPYAFIIEGHHFASAVFESASGLTTTGASVYSELDSFPKSLLFWRCLSQWIGGLGVVVFFVAILSFLGAGAKLLYSNEASAQSSELQTARVQEGVKRILFLYLIISGMCVVCLKATGLGWFDSICHMFATVSTGGFSTIAAGFGAYQNPAAEWVLIVFMALCGGSFLLMLRAIKGDFRALRTNSELRAYLLTITTATLILTFVLLKDYDSALGTVDALRRAAFHVISIMTTTGFATEDFALWPPIGRVMLLMLMIIGGCSGSTAGGVKAIRIVTAVKVCLHTIERSFRSHVVRRIQVNGRVLDRDEQESMMTFLVLIGLVTILGILCLAVFENGLSTPGVISAVFACLFNIGPGLAEVGPSRVYEFLSPHSKLLLSLLMIMGRVELYAILALFSPSLWRRFS